MGTLAKLLFIIAYVHTVARVSNAWKVASFPWHAPGHGHLSQWLSCIRIARKGLFHPDPTALDHLVVMVEAARRAGRPSPEAN